MKCKQWLHICCTPYRLRLIYQLLCAGYLSAACLKNVMVSLQGISFIIQSDKYSAAHLALRVELFVRDTVKRIASLPEVRDTRVTQFEVFDTTLKRKNDLNSKFKSKITQ
jgi:hypothetical protein